MSHSRRTGMRNMAGAKRLPRQMRYEDLPKENFTPRTYQVELLDSARECNTIICLGSSSGRMFIAVMLLKEMAEGIRRSPNDGQASLHDGQASPHDGQASPHDGQTSLHDGQTSPHDGQASPHDGQTSCDGQMIQEGLKSLGDSCVKPESDKAARSGAKKSFFLTDTDALVEQMTPSIQHPADVRVRPFTQNMAILDWSQDRWLQELESCEVLVTTGSIFLHLLNESIITLDRVNLLVMDQCHLVLEDHPYTHIMAVYKTTNQHCRPRILGLTASILAGKFYNPDSLECMITSLEKALESTAETSTLVISARYGIRPTEQVIECVDYEDTTGLVEELGQLLENAIDFLDECNIEVTEELDNRDPRQIPRAALIECHNILHQLGPWCAACLADMLIGQIEKIEKQKEFVTMHKRFLKIASTTLRMVSKIFDNHFKHCEYTTEDLLAYSTPKVSNLMNSLRKYRPEMDFVIISEELEDTGAGSDSELSDDSDFSDNNEDDTEASTPNSKPVHVAIKRVTPEGDKKSTDPFMQQEDKYLCGIVFVDHQHEAFALSKFIEEVCAWDEELCFVKSSHITAVKSASKKEKKLYKKQEDILRKFRMQELNLLVSTNVLEEGVDLPRCNLIVRFDTPKSYRSYSLSKGQARARDAEFLLLVEGENVDEFESQLKTYSQIEQVLIGRCKSKDTEPSSATNHVDNSESSIIPPYIPVPGNSSVQVSMETAIILVNRYCAKLPSDAFTHLTPSCCIQEVEQSDGPMYIASLRLPINSPIKTEIEGVPMPTVLKAKQAVALKMCECLHKEGELDDNLMPVGKEMFQGVEGDDEDAFEEEEDMFGEARPGTTKRKQYYWKKVAGALLQCHMEPDTDSCLYVVNMKLTGAITEEQNTRGRKICAPEDTPRGFGILTSKPIPVVPMFPVFTRSGEVTVSCDLLRTGVRLSVSQMDCLQQFHKFLFSNVLRLEKDPMDYVPTEAGMDYLIVPLNKEVGDSELDIDWEFTEKVKKSMSEPNRPKDTETSFKFVHEDYEDAVVMPSYRNIDQPQYFYVAEIRSDLNPQSQFPSPELYKTFAEYYTSKYGLSITNLEQPLLDVDHTSARLNLLIPRYMNQKGVALPTSSAETKKARRENLQQKQILVPELCDIHVFLASLWRKAVCLPAILYRMNYLLLAEEIRKHVAMEIQIGIAELPEEFRFPKLDFGFDTSPENLKLKSDSEDHSDQSTDDLAADGEQSAVSVNTNENNCEDVTDIVEGENDISQKSIGSDTNIPDNCLQTNNGNNPSDSGCDIRMETSDANNAFHDDQSAQTKAPDEHEVVIDEQNSVNAAEEELACEEDTVSDISATTEMCNNENLEAGMGNAEWKNDNRKIDETFRNNEKNSPKTVNWNGNIPTDCKRSVWDEDSLHGTKINQWNERIVCSLCMTLSQDLGLDDLSVTHCPQCSKPRQAATSLKETPVKLDTTNASQTKSINGEIVEPILDSSIDSVTENVEKMSMQSKNDIKVDACSSSRKDISEKSQGALSKEIDTDTQPNMHSEGNKVIAASDKCATNYDNKKGVPAEKQDIVEQSSKEGVVSEYEYTSSKLNTKVPSDKSTVNDETDVFSNMGKFERNVFEDEEDKSDVNQDKNPKALISLDADMDLSTFIGPSPCVILQALTMSNANDFFSLERLETIGDSFLKYAITVYLYCSYPGVHEGKLSYLRSKQVSNYNLYRLGKRKGLAECMISTKFEPYENWLPPGYIINENKRKGSVPSVPVCPLPTNSGSSTIFCNDSGAAQGSECSFKHCDDVSSSSVWDMDDFSKELQEADKILQDEELEKDEKNISENMFPYSLQVHHCLPDKSIADCVEALIGAYLTSCDKMAALKYMSWMGLKVLPRKDKTNDDGAKSAEDFEPLPCPGSPFLSDSRDADSVLEHLLDGYDGFEAKIGYRFRDRSYLLQAFTHTSYHYNTVTDCYQRLEFLGDAVLDYVITRHLYEDSVKFSPGVLTDLRSALVNNNIFAALAVKWDFHKYLKAVSPALFYVMEKFVTRQKEMEDEIDIEEEEADENHEEEHMELEAPKALGDIFESVAGAIYMDSGKSLDVVWGVYYRIMKTQIDRYLKNIPKSPVRELLEQEPETAKFDKPERTIDGKIRVTVNVVGKGVFTGVGRNYRIAKSAAAKKALRCIKTLQMQGLI